MPSEDGQWRAFVGDWSDGEGTHDWVCLDKRDLSWESARDAIRARLDGFGQDSCPFCERDAERGVAKLDALPAGEPFAWEVEGTDYVIARGVQTHG